MGWIGCGFYRVTIAEHIHIEIPPIIKDRTPPRNPKDEPHSRRRARSGIANNYNYHAVAVTIQCVKKEDAIPRSRSDRWNPYS